MKLPWVSRAHHEEIRGLLEDRLRESEAERKACLNRLSVFGLGGALFTEREHVASAEQEAEQDTPADEEALMLAALRHRPGKLAAAITNKLKREKATRLNPNARGEMVARIPISSVPPDVTKMLDEAEEQGRTAAWAGK